MRKLILMTLAALAALPADAQFSKARRPYVEYIVTASHADRIYRTNERASLRIEAYKGGVALEGVKVYYKTGDEMLAPEREDSATFHNGIVCIPMGTSRKPGFKACDLRFSVYGQTYKDLVKVAFTPKEIKTLTTVPPDFDQFWQSSLNAVNNVPFNPEVTLLPQHSTNNVEVSLVKLTVGNNGRHMFGYLTRPKDGKPHPVLFCPPGAGSQKITPTTYYSDHGYIYLNVNIHNGCNPELNDSDYAVAREAAAAYNRRGIGAKETFYYRDVYTGCSRCIDYLCSLPDWDRRNVGVTGGSQGGALTIVTAALNKKVTFCAPFYPALCDLLGFKYGRAGGWPKYFRDGAEAAGAEATLPYFDVVCFASRLKCPVFFSFGYNDDTCSPTSTYSAFNAITSPKRLAVTPTSGHWRFPETNDEAMAWMEQQMK